MLPSGREGGRAGVITARETNDEDDDDDYLYYYVKRTWWDTTSSIHPRLPAISNQLSLLPPTTYIICKQQIVLPLREASGTDIESSSTLELGNPRSLIKRPTPTSFPQTFKPHS